MFAFITHNSPQNFFHLLSHWKLEFIITSFQKNPLLPELVAGARD
jgi:hypothetical protein